MTPEMLYDMAELIEININQTTAGPTISWALEHILGYNPYTRMSMGEIGQSRYIDFVPDTWGVSMLRQWQDGKMLWTVTLSILEGPHQLASTRNSVSGRSEALENAVAAAIIRAAAIIPPEGDEDVAKAA